MMPPFPYRPPVLAVLLALALLTGGQARGQDQTEAPEKNPYGSGFGAQVLLTNSGFGLGGYFQTALTPGTSFAAELSLGAGKDEREVSFFDRFGRKDIPDKANYLLIIPAQIGLQQRLFQDTIEENFRPFLQFMAGPTLGWEYPYFKDENGNQLFDEGEKTFDSFSALPRGHARFGVGGSVAFGAHFGVSRKVTQGVRFGYTFTHFFQGIQLLEPDVQRARHFFGTPFISVIFGKLF